jgi:hypothetical protein
LRPEIGLSGAFFVATGSGFVGDGAGFVAGGFECDEGGFEVAVFDLARDVEDFAGVSATVVGAAESGEENNFECRMLEEVGRLGSRGG